MKPSKGERKDLFNLAPIDLQSKVYDGSYIKAHKIDAVMLVKKWQEKKA